MVTELTGSTDAMKVDLSGLPEPVVQGIRSFVQTLRESLLSKESPLLSGERIPLRGRFANLNLSIPKEDLDEAQRETWASFPGDFPGSDKL
jgi:hypothetical protein